MKKEIAQRPMLGHGFSLRERSDVFTRMQLPYERPPAHLMISDAPATDIHYSQPSLKINDQPRYTSRSSRYNVNFDNSEHKVEYRKQREEIHDPYLRTWEDRRGKGTSRQSNHSDRIIRRRDAHVSYQNNGGARYLSPSTSTT